MTRRRTTLKTPEQLEREIAYYAAQIKRTTSADRQRRAHTAIRTRERQLTEARRIAASTTSTQGVTPLPAVGAPLGRRVVPNAGDSGQ